MIGDVQVLPASKKPDVPTPPLGSPPKLTPNEVPFAELFERAVGSGLEDRVALPGVQDKVSGRMITLPVADRQAAWILKLNPPEFPGLVQNEAFFLKAARDSGLEVAEAKVIHDRDERPGLLQQLAFAYLSCNGDAHGKNFSILKVRDEWRVAPAYGERERHGRRSDPEVDYQCVRREAGSLRVRGGFASASHDRDGVR